MEETSRSDSVKKRLRMQNEVLKWLADFSDKLQQRAKETATEVNGLLDQAGAAELDLKNTVNTLWNLSHSLLIDHKISDEDEIARPMKDHSEGSAQSSIPAQDYENDILPRYRKALSLGLSSCRKHLHTTEIRHKANSVFKTGSAYGLLPHIIGSEEYIHDNSCGITESLSMRNPQLDFGLIMESKRASSVAEEPDSLDLFGPDMFGIQKDSLDKDLTDPLASAASDFKAMLEAALLNPYKFYDEESLSVNDDVRSKMDTGQLHKDVVRSSGEQQTISHGTSELLNSTIEEEKLVTEGRLLPDAHACEFYSSLVGGSLFDAEEDLLSFGQKDSADFFSTVAESYSLHSGIKDHDEFAESSHSFSIHEASGDSDQCLMVPAGEGNSVCDNEEESGQMASLEQVNFEEDERRKQTPCKSENNGSSSLAATSDQTLSYKEPCESDDDVFEKDKIQNSSKCNLKDSELPSLVAIGEEHLSNKEPCKSDVDSPSSPSDENESLSRHRLKDNNSPSPPSDGILSNKEPSEPDHNFSESLQG